MSIESGLGVPGDEGDSPGTPVWLALPFLAALLPFSDPEVRVRATAFANIALKSHSRACHALLALSGPAWAGSLLELALCEEAGQRGGTAMRTAAAAATAGFGLLLAAAEVGSVETRRLFGKRILYMIYDGTIYGCTKDAEACGAAVGPIAGSAMPVGRVDVSGSGRGREASMPLFLHPGLGCVPPWDAVPQES